MTEVLAKKYEIRFRKLSDRVKISITAKKAKTVIMSEYRIKKMNI